MTERTNAEGGHDDSLLEACSYSQWGWRWCNRSCCGCSQASRWLWSDRLKWKHIISALSFFLSPSLFFSPTLVFHSLTLRLVITLHLERKQRYVSFFELIFCEYLHFRLKGVHRNALLHHHRCSNPSELRTPILTPQISRTTRFHRHDTF